MRSVEAGGNRPHQFHIPSLDGVRAVAFAIVMISHIPTLGRFPGGLGVTVFFFLSGFLITTLLRREFLKTQRISIKNFYIRRVLRIFPPMYLTLIVGIVLSALHVLPGEPTLRGIAAEAAHLTNYFLIAGHDAEVVAGQRVYWSLAVEEHFYLVFPLAAAAMLGRLGPARSTRVVLVGCAVILAWRIALVCGFQASAVRMQYSTDTRIDSILYGVVMALSFNPVFDKPRLTDARIAALAFSSAIFGILLTVIVPSFLFRETFRYSIQGVLLAPIFYVLITRPEWPLIRWLNAGWVRYLGTVSYTLYLVHDSVFHAIYAHWPSLPRVVVAGLGFTVAFGYSALMRNLVERPLLAWRLRFREPPAVSHLGTASGALNPTAHQ